MMQNDSKWVEVGWNGTKTNEWFEMVLYNLKLDEMIVNDCKWLT